MNPAKLSQIYEDAANGSLSPEQASNMLASVCEYAIMLEQKVNSLKKQVKSLKSQG
jgi:glycerol-3-phosphate responsive antiterminator